MDYTKQKQEIMFDMAMSVQYIDAYCRYSSHMQDDGNSIEYQVEEIEKWCENHGFVVRRWFIDKAKSAKETAGRDGFYDLVEDINDGIAAPNLIVWKMNRLFRNSYESHKYRKFFRDKGVKLHAVTQTIDEDTSAGRLTTNILSDIDQYKSEEIAEHVTAALRSMVKRGFYTGQRIPLGYTTVPAFDGDKPRKKYAIDEKTAPIVQEIFRQFVDGVPPSLIVEWANTQGIRTRKDLPYDYDAMHRLLKNDFYIGTRRYTAKGQEPIIIPNAVPALIDEKTFDTVQEIFLSRRKTEPQKGRRSNRVRTYYISGKAICAQCNEKFYGKSNGDTPYYMCKNKTKKKSCDCKSIQKKHLETAVFNALREYIFSPRSVNMIVSAVLSDIKKNPAKKAESKEVLLSKKEKLLQESVELVQMKLDGSISKEVFAMMKKPKDEAIADIETKLLALQQQKRSTIDESTIIEYLSRLTDNLESGNEDVIKYVVDNTIDKVIVSNSKVEIYLAVFFGAYAHNRRLELPNYTLCVCFSREEIVKMSK